MSSSIFARVTLRPVRVGFVMEGIEREPLLRAVQLATSTWGGMFFPILLASETLDHLLARAMSLGLDVLVPVDDSLIAQEASTSPGFTWRAFSRSPFNREHEGIRDHALVAADLYDWLSRRAGLDPIHVRWGEDHPYRDLAAVLYGEFGRSDPGYSDQRAYDQRFPTLELPSDEWLVGGGRRITAQLGVTGHDVVTRPIVDDFAIAVVRPQSVDDLIAFWNIRASGCDVLPWIVGAEDQSRHLAEDWVKRLAAQPRWQGRPPIAHLYAATELSLPDDIKQMLAESDCAVFAGESLTPAALHSAELRTAHQKWARADFDAAEDSQISIELPTLDFLPRPGEFSQSGIIAAEIEVVGEYRMPPQVRAKQLALRALTPSLSRMTTDAFIRATSSGFVRSVQTSDDSVGVPVIRSETAIQDVMQVAGVAVEFTEEGRRATLLVERMGGPKENSLANQPAVRRVMDKLMRADSPVPQQALLNVARENAGAWPGNGLWSHFLPERDYPRSVLQALTSIGFVLTVMETKCLRCGATVRAEPEELGGTIRCDLCQFAATLDRYAIRRTDWRFVPAQIAQAKRLNEIYPMMAALSVLSKSASVESTIPLYSLNTKVKVASGNCEVDLVVLIEGLEVPTVVILEAKSYKDTLKTNDVEHMEEIQSLLRHVGIECWIGFATLRQELEESEIAILRRSAERGLVTISSPASLSSSTSPLLPLVLTGKHLSVPEDDDLYPEKLAGGALSLASLSAALCTLHLGLMSATWNPDWSWSPIWTT